MGMGYSAMHSDNITAEDLQKLSPLAYKGLIDALEAIDSDLEEFAMDMAISSENISEENIKTVMPKYNALLKHLYMVHELDVEINYHNSDDSGSRYDEVDGFFFDVNNRMIRNPELSVEIHDMINRKFYVTYG